MKSFHRSSAKNAVHWISHGHVIKRIIKIMLRPRRTHFFVGVAGDACHVCNNQKWTRSMWIIQFRCCDVARTTMALYPGCVWAKTTTECIAFLHVLYHKEYATNDVNADCTIGTKRKYNIAKAGFRSSEGLQYSIKFRMVIANIVSLNLGLVLSRRCLLFWQKSMITPGLNFATKGFFKKLLA